MIFLPAIVGECVGSLYEFGTELHTPSLPFAIDPLIHCFTDESVLLAASCDAILSNISHCDALLKWHARYPDVSWGTRFERWCLEGGGASYQSYGNGCLARALPHSYAHNNLSDCVDYALEAISITHDHPESIKATEAFVSLIFLARTKAVDKLRLRKIASKFYDLDCQWAPIERADPRWESCDAVMIPALKAVFDCDSFEEAILTAMQQAMDTDSVAYVVGALSEALTMMAPIGLQQQALALLPADIVDVLDEFGRRYGYATKTE